MPDKVIPYISIVVPVFKEADKIAGTISTIHRYFKERGCRFEMIVVDDCSPDDTFERASKLKLSYPELRVLKLEKNTRKGGAVKEGILEAIGEYILFTDADLAVSIDQIENLFKPILEEGFDVAIGSRGLANSQILRSQSPIREMMGKIYGRLINLLIISGVRDTQCGFKCFKRETAHNIFKNLIGYTPVPAFDIEELLMATKIGYKVAEVPVTWAHNPETRIPYNWKSSIKVFLELLRIKKRWRIILPHRIKKSNGKVSLS